VKICTKKNIRNTYFVISVMITLESVSKPTFCIFCVTFHLVLVVTVALELILNCLHREVKSFASIFWQGQEIFLFSEHPDWLWGPLSLGYWGLFPGDEMFGA